MSSIDGCRVRIDNAKIYCDVLPIHYYTYAGKGNFIVGEIVTIAWDTGSSSKARVTKTEGTLEDYLERFDFELMVPNQEFKSAWKEVGF